MSNKRKFWAVFLAALLIGAALVLGLGGVSGSFGAAYFASSGVTYGIDGGPSATITSDLEVDEGEFADDANTLNLTTSKGQVLLSSSADTHADIDQFNGTWTKVSGLDVTNGTLTINPDDKRAIGVEGDTDRLEFRDATLDDGTVDVIYAGASGTTTLTIRGLPANQGVVAVDADSGTKLGLASTDGSGTVTLSGLPNSEHRVTLQSASAPVLSDPDPSENLSTAPDEFSVHVSDEDFSADSVTVEWYYEGTKFDTTTGISSDGRVSTSNLPNIEDGITQWRAVATDDVGNTDSVTVSVGVPTTLHIKNETNASEYVNDAEVTIRFFEEGNDTVVERTTNDGKIDMAGLPADTEFVVTASADGYLDRRVFVESLYHQQTVYLLPENETKATILFRLDDSTGRFPASETTLFVEKPLNISGNVTYRTVVSDQFGASNEFVADLADQQRYRLRVKNREGETRVLGAYTTSGDDTATLPIGQVRFEGDVGPGPTFQARTIEENGQSAIRIVYRDPTDKTDELQLEVVNASNSSDVLRANTSETGPFGTYAETVPIPAGDEDTRWKVRYHANRSNATDVGGTVYAGSVGEFLGNLPGISSQVLELIGWVALLCITGLAVIVDTRLGAMAAVITASLFTMVGVMSIPTPLLGIAGATALLFVIGGDRL